MHAESCGLNPLYTAWWQLQKVPHSSSGARTFVRNPQKVDWGGGGRGSRATSPKPPLHHPLKWTVKRTSTKSSCGVCDGTQ